MKKGQFLAPWDMRHVVAKITGAGNRRVLVCERGASFGYNTLVSDMRSLPLLAETGCPVVFDATHSVQQPGRAGGGERRAAGVRSRARAGGGCGRRRAVFMETHPAPDEAPPDGPNMVPLDALPRLLDRLLAFERAGQEFVRERAMSEGCVFIGGEYVAPEDAKMSIFDAGFVWSDTVYDVTSTWAGWFFMLDEHLERFARSCAGFRLENPYTAARCARSSPSAWRGRGTTTAT